MSKRYQQAMLLFQKSFSKIRSLLHRPAINQPETPVNSNQADFPDRKNVTGFEENREMRDVHVQEPERTKMAEKDFRASQIFQKPQETKSSKDPKSPQSSQKKKPKVSEPPPPVDPSTIAFSDPTEDQLSVFWRADLRVGKLLEVTRVEGSEKLYQTKVDLGNEVRQILTGLQKHVSLEDMRGLVVVFANLPPRKMMGLASEGMILACSRKFETSDTVVLLRPQPNSHPGARIALRGYPAPHSTPPLFDAKDFPPLCELLHTGQSGQPRFANRELVVDNEPLENSQVFYANIN